MFIMIICIDVDGTLFKFDKYVAYQFGEPMPGAREFLERMHNDGHSIRIQTTRSDAEYGALFDWLRKYDMLFFISDIQCGGKICATVYVDDRAVRFAGDWEEVERQCRQVELDVGPP